MAFGLKNAAETTHRSMDIVLASVRWQFLLVYLAGIVVFFNSPASHIEQARREFRLLYKARVTIKLNNRKFYADTADYIGHIIRPGLGLAEHTTDGVVEL